MTGAYEGEDKEGGEDDAEVGEFTTLASCEEGCSSLAEPKQASTCSRSRSPHCQIPQQADTSSSLSPSQNNSAREMGCGEWLERNDSLSHISDVLLSTLSLMSLVPDSTDDDARTAQTTFEAIHNSESGAVTRDGAGYQPQEDTADDHSSPQVWITTSDSEIDSVASDDIHDSALIPSSSGCESSCESESISLHLPEEVEDQSASPLGEYKLVVTSS